MHRCLVFAEMLGFAACCFCQTRLVGIQLPPCVRVLPVITEHEGLRITKYVLNNTCKFLNCEKHCWIEVLVDSTDTNHPVPFLKVSITLLTQSLLPLHSNASTPRVSIYASGLILPLLSRILSTLLLSSSNLFLRLTSASFLFSLFWNR